MKKITIIALIGIVLTSCKGAPQQTDASGNPEFTIDLLFEKNGCKMYRFSDAGELIYWSDCSGNAEYVKAVHHSNGKTSSTTYVRHQTITTP